MKDLFLQILKENNLKVTKNRIAILEELNKHEIPITAEEIFNAISKSSDEKYSLSSVYRALNNFCDKSIVKKIAEIDGTTYFQLKSTHSHSLICIKCKTIIPIKHCPINPIIKEIEEKTDFIITNHHLEIKGICGHCKAEIPKKEIEEIKSESKCDSEHVCKNKNCI